MTRYETVKPLDLIGLMAVVWRGKFFLLLTMICAMLLGGYYAFHIASPQYQATATLQIETAPAPLHVIADHWVGTGTDPASLNTEVTVVTSNRVLAQVVDQLDLLQDPEFNRYLQAQSPYSFSALRGRLRHFLAGTTPSQPDSAAVYEKTIQNLRAALTAHRPEDTYIFEINARSGSPQKALVLANVTAAAYVADQQRLKDAASSTAESWLTARVATLEQQLGVQETAVNALIATAQIQEDAKLDAISNQILTSEQRLDEAQSTLARLQSATATQSPRQSAEIAQLQTEISNIRRQRDRLRAQLSAQSAGLVRLHQMQREAEATRALYETFLARLQETRVQRGLETPSTQIITPASSARYLGPQKMLILEIAAVLGGLLGLTFIMLRETMRTGARDRATLQEAIGLPVFAQTGVQPIRNLRQLRRALDGVLAPAMRTLRTELMLAAEGNTPAMILFTASRSGEGKSAHAIALANALAQAGKDVLFISADQTKPGVAKFLNSHPKAGIADVFAGRASLSEALAMGTPFGCDVLLANARYLNDDPVLSDQLDNLNGALRERYDHIIVDAPPVVTEPTAALWAQHADAVIYTVQSCKTPLATVQAGLDKLENAGAPATGLILTKVGQSVLRQNTDTAKWRSGRPAFG